MRHDEMAKGVQIALQAAELWREEKGVVAKTFGGWERDCGSLDGKESWAYLQEEEVPSVTHHELVQVLICKMG